MDTDVLWETTALLEGAASLLDGERHVPSADVRVARRVRVAINRAFAECRDDYSELLDDEIEWIPITGQLDGRTYRGHHGVRRWVEASRDVWRAYRITWHQIRDLGEGRVLAFGAWDCVGRQGGVELSFDQGAWLMDVCDGRMTRMEAFADRRDALEAAGL
jgi:ketosteroid isomerase-like protein